MDPSRDTSKEMLLSEFGKALLKINALRIGTFETADGKITPYFIDLRKLASFPTALALAVKCLDHSFAAKEKSFGVECICGIPISGLILSSLLVYRREIPLIYPSKVHPNSIVGLLKPGTEVLVVDDVSETGHSIKSAIHAIRSSGGVVSHALTLIDRLEGADKALSDLGVMLHYFTTTEELISTLRENMVLSDEQLEALQGGSKN